MNKKTKNVRMFFDTSYGKEGLNLLRMNQGRFE
jgi:hypothetical protein